MFREMRRKKQALSPEECAEILSRGTAGVLAVSGEEGYPYAVPLSYVYHEGKLFFHSAKAGHKLDAIAGNDKVSFCVIDQDQIVPDEYTSYFRSVIVFGRVRVLEDEGEKRSTLAALAKRYSPEHEESRISNAVEKGLGAVAMLELTIDHMSGKEAAELMSARSAPRQ